MNQCDGCKAGMKLNEFKIHYDDKGKLHMVCTKRKYTEKETPDDNNQEISNNNS